MAFERNPDTVQVKAEVRVMWPDGPSRRWSSVRCSEARDPYGEKDGYVGNYVCQACTLPVMALYCVKAGREVPARWICAGCLDAEKPKKKPTTESDSK